MYETHYPRTFRMKSKILPKLHKPSIPVCLLDLLSSCPPHLPQTPSALALRHASKGPLHLAVVCSECTIPGSLPGLLLFSHWDFNLKAMSSRGRSLIVPPKASSSYLLLEPATITLLSLILLTLLRPYEVTHSFICFMASFTYVFNILYVSSAKEKRNWKVKPSRRLSLTTWLGQVTLFYYAFLPQLVIFLL